MVNIAQSEFNCQAGDVSCYCNNANFGYGVRDCSNQACSPSDAAQAIAYASSYCASK